MSTILLVSSIAAAIFYSSWAWLAAFVLIVWKAHIWFHYKNKPWKRVHYRMMRAQAGALGIEANSSKQEEREFSMQNALVLMLDMIDPVKLSLSNENTVYQAAMYFESGHDLELVRKLYLPNKYSPSQADEISNSIAEHLAGASEADEKFFVSCTTIAAIVEAQFSLQDRAEYMFNVFTGRAR